MKKFITLAKNHYLNTVCVKFLLRFVGVRMTTLLERRMHGDLIETLKIVNGFTDYGRDWFTLSL